MKFMKGYIKELLLMIFLYSTGKIKKEKLEYKKTTRKKIHILVLC